MTSLRHLGRSPCARLLAPVLTASLLAALLSPNAEASRALVVDAADPAKLTKSAFGELLAHTGTDPQPYAFTGEPYDPNIGFQYHRARWMDGRTGRFLSVDPWAGTEVRPSTLHRYLYAADDPVTKRDPSGRDFSIAASMAATQMNNVFAGIAQINEASVLNSTPFWHRVALPGDKASQMETALQTLLTFEPSARCDRDCIQKLNRSHGFTLEAFRTYLSAGAAFFDGTASRLLSRAPSIRPRRRPHGLTNSACRKPSR